jgi:benzoate transport
MTSNIESLGPENPEIAAGAERLPDLLDKWTPTQLVVMLLCFLANVNDGMDVVIMSYIAPTIMEEWVIGADSMGVVFSVSLLGMALGGIGLSPLADYLGRRKVVIAALAISSTATILCGLVTNVTQLMILRFFIGVGIGTALPCMAALISEYAPEKYRNFAVGALYAGWPLGSIFTGFVSAWTIPAFGWQATLVGAGVLTAIQLPFLWIFLPESMQYLVKRKPAGALEKLNAIFARLDHPPVSEMPLPDEAYSKPGVAGLWSDGRALSTALLWGAMIFGFASLWFTIAWIPQLATMAGLDVTNARIAGAIFNAGAFIGTLTLGLITVRMKLQPTIMTFLVSAAVVMVLFGVFRFSLPITMMIAFVIGFLQMGGFNGIYALGTQLYPMEVRSTGVGWMTGVGRAGAILGPLIGGVLIEADLPLSVIFLVFAVPTVLCALCAYLVNLGSVRNPGVS